MELLPFLEKLKWYKSYRAEGVGLSISKYYKQIVFFTSVKSKAIPQKKLAYLSTSTQFLFSYLNLKILCKKYTSGPRYWNVPVLVNTGTFLVYQYCLKMWYLRPLERAGVIQKLTILERKDGLVLSNTRVPVSGTCILFPIFDWFSVIRDSL